MNRMQDNRKKLYDILTSFSIEMKIYGMVITVIVLITIISLLVVRLSITNTMTNELHEKVKSIASDVSARSGDLVLTRNIYALNKLVTGIVESYHDLEYVFIVDKNGKLLVDSIEDKSISNELIAFNRIQKEGDLYQNSVTSFESDKGVIIDAAAPVLEDYGGTVRVGLRLDSLHESLNRITSQMIITMIGILVLAGIIVLAITRTITYPITKLVELTSKVSKGDLSSRIEIFPNDEIGKLTNSFNHMLDHLEQSESTRETFFQTIQNRNKELLLLNELSMANVTTAEQLRDLLQGFVTHLVNELSLNSSDLHVKILEKQEVFKYSLVKCDQKCQPFNFKEHSSSSCPLYKKEINRYPLISNNKEVGVLKICSKNKLDSYSHQIITSIAKQIAIVVENVHLWHELRKKEEIRIKLLEKVIQVQEDERKRIARELHDETSHSLSSILLGLKIIQESDDEEERNEQLVHLRTITQDTIKEVHNLAWQLRPTILDKFGLTVALERYTEEFQEKNEIEVDLIIRGLKNIRLKPEVETAIFRVIQEALTNVAKYARAKCVSIILLAKSEQISIVIEDDGIGFEAEKALKRTPSRHNLGLHGMTERISLLGGTLDIESTLGEGTTIYAKIPMIKEKVD